MSVGDAKKEARHWCRLTFFKYEEIMPERASILFNSFQKVQQKAIMEQENAMEEGRQSEFLGNQSSPKSGI